MIDVDRELLERCRAGDRGASDELFARHQSAIAGYFARRAGDAARDLVQETWLQVLKSQDNYRSEASFRTFLFAVAHNVLRHHFRRLGSRESDLGITSVSSSEPSPASLVHRRFELGVLHRALSELPEEHRMMLEMTYESQLTSEQIGELLQVPSATVRTRIRRARTLLREDVERLSRADPDLVTSALETFDLWVKQVAPSEPAD